PSTQQDADVARERSWAAFFKEAGDLCHFPDDNGTLHVGLATTSDMALAEDKKLVFLEKYFSDKMPRPEMTSILVTESARIMQCGPVPTILQMALIGGVVSAGECGLISL
ncbi:Hypothetical protein FKW44_002059, partial [Caligus rogercresseyi]